MTTALVTGAGQGIGRAIARRLAADGHEVVVVDVDLVQARVVAEELGGRAFDADVADAAAVRALAEGVGQLDALVNCAGVYPMSPITEVTTGMFERVMGVNVLGPLLLTQAFLPALTRSGGSVVNIASVAARMPIPGIGVYSPSKAALVSLTQLCAVELGALGVRFNAVGPGDIVTEGSARIWTDDERWRRTDALMPLGRRGTPADVADVVSFLVSPAAAYVTGQIIYVDGGMSQATSRFLRTAQDPEGRLPDPSMAPGSTGARES